MRTLYIVFALTWVITGASCKNKEKAVNEEKVVVEEFVEKEEELPVAEELVGGMENSLDNPVPTSHKMGGTEKSDSLVFSIGRTPCFGRCKAYFIHVYRSGYATFNGNSNVEKIGLHDGKIGQDTLLALVNEAYRIGFFAMEDKYDGPVTDLPSTVIHVVANGKDKTVVGRVGTPVKFKAFATMADELLMPVAWKPVVAKN